MLLNQKGFAPIIIVVLAAAVLLIGGTAVYIHQTNQSQLTVPATPSPIPPPTSTPTSTPSPTLKPTTKPTTKPTQKPTATPLQTSQPSTASAPQSGLHADPNNITLTKKKSELRDDIAEFTLYYPGTHSVDVGPSDGTIGIYGLFKDNNSTFIEVHDSAKIEVGFVSAFGHDIKSGENKLNLQIKEGSSLIDALNGSVILNIPVTITVSD